MKHLFVLNGPTANRGCEAILLSTYAILRDATPDCECINASFQDDRVAGTGYLQLDGLTHSPEPGRRSPETLAQKLQRRLRGRRFHFERFLPEADWVFSLGGDNYSSDYDNVGMFLDANDRIIASGKRLVIWGASIGPFVEPALERRVARQLARTALIVVREKRSLSYLAGLGIRDNVHLMADPAFSLVPAPVSLPAGIEAALDAGAVGLNLSGLLARFRPQPERWKADAVDIVKQLLGAVPHPVLLVPHVFKKGSNDQIFLREVYEAAGGDSRLLLLEGENLSSPQLKGVIARLRYFIGARTHATIAAMSSNVPTISVAYSAKAWGINEEVFGSSRWIIDQRTLDGSALVEKLRELTADDEAVRLHLKEVNRTYRIDPAKVGGLLRS